MHAGATERLLTIDAAMGIIAHLADAVMLLVIMMQLCVDSFTL